MGVYYSCSMPMHINGSIPRSQYSCPGVMPSDWPQVWIGDGGRPVGANVPGTYRRESAQWDLVGEHHWLLDAPARYRDQVGNLVPNPTTTTTSTSTTTTETSTKAATLVSGSL